MILIATCKDDLTSDYLIRRIEERGFSVFRFNTEDTLTQYELSIRIAPYNEDFIIYDKYRDESLHSRDIIGAYFRKPRNPILIHDKSHDQNVFDQQELNEAIRSIWRGVPKHRWLNYPEDIWAASNKPKQLSTARKIGFNIPDTLISSRSNELIDFYFGHKQDVIIKATKHGFLPHGNATSLIFTTKFDKSDLPSLEASNTTIPFIMQPRLEKKYDLRVTIVGEAVFAVALHSQQHQETSIDWRTWDVTADVTLFQENYVLPERVSNMCIEINRHFSLKFSCIDLVLTETGEIYFLELNPNGQWAWLEELLNVPIRDAIINQLTA